MPGPLEGLKVLDIATVLAGPFAATLMSDYGAEVVKLELPGKGDGMRAFPPFKDGKSLWWKSAQRDLDEVLDAFQKAEGTLAPIYAIDQIVKDPQVRARQSIIGVADSHFGSIDMPNIVPRFLHDRPALKHAAGELGQYNEAVFGKRLGLSTQDMDKLKAAGVI
jgi:crotonobetainyl-CoA:carnitine CoA-transferase CaiB-like acyl-CoA transferase